MKFERVLNTRDFGGLSTVRGQSLTSGKLFRGAQLSNMNENDRQIMSGLDVNLVVDFRYKNERERQATKTGDGFSPSILVYNPEFDIKSEAGLAPHEQFILHEVNGPESSRGYMRGSYSERPNQPAFVDLTQRSLAQMAAGGDTLYVHCAAGKDRTGTFVAILLRLLGVSDGDIMADYLRSNDVEGLEKIMERATKALSERTGRLYNVETLRPFFGVEPDYLMRSLDAMGDFDTYVRDVLGLNHEIRDQLRAQYLR